MKTIKWSVDFEWQYDLDAMVNEVQYYLNEHFGEPNIEVGNVAWQIVHNAIAAEDDYIYYNFSEEQYKFIVYQILRRLKLQAPLF